MAGICTAINLHNNAPCTAEIAPVGAGVFCSFHARQCHALYMGYKRRTKELEDLEAKPPKSLPKNYQGTDFNAVEDETVLKDCHQWILQRWKLLHRCVVAREEHHKHFFKDTSDYGHQAFVDRLKSTRNTLSIALGKLDVRLMTLQHSAEQWYSWVRSAQEAESAASVSQKTKVKSESKLFKEHQASVAAEKKREEEKRREELEKEEVWDPIEMLVSSIRVGYITLVMLLLKEESTGEAEMDAAMERAKELYLQDVAERSQSGAGSVQKYMDVEKSRELSRQRLMKGLKERGEDRMVIRPFKVQAGGKLKGLKGKEDKKVKENDSTEEAAKEGNEETAMEKYENDDGGDGNDDDDDERKDLMELKDIEDEDLKKLLLMMNEFVMSSRGHFVYTGEGNLHDKLKNELKIIREYLLLRLIITNPTMLQVSLEKDNIKDFLHDERVRNTDLRDLALGLARFDTHAVRDACADYWAAQGSGGVSSKLKNDKDKTPEKEMEEQRVKVCGRWIHNYPLERPISRRGWMQFALLTAIPFDRALELCVSWEEFYELNVLAIQGYFAGLPFNWYLGSGSLMEDHLSRIGFVTFGISDDASEKVGSSYPRNLPKDKAASSLIKEPMLSARNWIWGVMGRNDAGARRFISMLQAWPVDFLVYARDCKTGKVISEPPEEHRWLTRVQVPFKGGRNPRRAGWEVVESFDKAFISAAQAERRWKQTFKDAIEVCVIDRYSGRDLTNFGSSITKLLNKAMKFKDGFFVMEKTFNIYRRCAEAEYGSDTEQVEKVKQVQQQIKVFRRGRTRKQILGDESPEAYYDKVDEEIDWRYGVYDNDRYWRKVGGDEEPVGDGEAMDDLVKRMNKMTDDKKRKELMKQAAAKIILKNMNREYKDDEINEFNASDDEEFDNSRALTQGESSASGEKALVKRKDTNLDADEAAKEEEEGWSEGDSDGWSEDWDDEESDEEVLVWREAAYEAEDLMEWCEDFARQIDQDFREQDPDAATKWAHMRDTMMGVKNRVNSGKIHNAREQKRLKRREAAAMDRFQGTSYFPPNLTYCTRCVEMLWGDEEEGLENFPVLLDKESRAMDPPPRKTWKIPESVFEEWDKMKEQEALKRQSDDSEDDEEAEFEGVPELWVKTIRMTIAKLWKEGLLKPSYEFAAVPAIAGQIAETPTPNSMPPDNIKMFSDYRELLRDGHIEMDYPPPHPSKDPSYFLNEMEIHEKKVPGTTYAFLKLLTDEYVWPDSLEKINRENTAIRDPQSRRWEWIKTPKDLPYSEREIHHLLSELTAPNRNMSPEVSKYVRYRVDTVLIMVPNEYELRNSRMPTKEAKDFIALACTGFRKRQIGINIDWARSFVGVNAAFLRRLPAAWWD